MAYENSQLHRLRIAEETTFGTDQTSGGTSFTNFLDLPIVRGTFRGGREEAELDPMVDRAYIDHYEPHYRGPKASGPTWDMLLYSHDTPLDGDTTPVDSTSDGMALLLKTLMGGERVETPAGAVTTVQAGTTATTINVTTGHGTRFGQGTAIGVVIGGRLECREVSGVSGDAVSVKIAFSAVPTTGVTAYGAVTYYLTADPDNTLQVAFEHKETSARYGYLGCNGGFSLSMGNGELARMNPQLMGASWLKYGTASLTHAGISNFQPIAVKDSEFIIGEVGDTTRYLIHTSEREWAPNLAYEFPPSSAGIEGKIRAKRIHQPPVLSGSFTTYRDGSGYDWETAQQNRTDLTFHQQLGAEAGGAILLSASGVHAWLPDDADINGVLGMSVAWKSREDQELNGTDQRRSAFRIHRF